MSFSGLDEPAWGADIETPAADIVKDALRKETILKEIKAAQDDLRVLLARAKTVQGEIDKLASGNATLQMYIDNLTVQMAKRR